MASIKRAKTQAQLDHATDLRLRKAYGITLADYNARLAASGGRCEICQRLPLNRRLNVDHDHAWKKVKYTSAKFGGVWQADATYRGMRHSASSPKKSQAVKDLKRLLLQSSVRGIICWFCNGALRPFWDRPDLLKAAATYLERHQGATDASNNKG